MASYKCVEKLNKPTGQWEPMYPLRVVGFAYELGHKVVHEHGPGFLSPADFKRVRVSGKVRVLTNSRWRYVYIYRATVVFLRRFVCRVI